MLGSSIRLALDADTIHTCIALAIGANNDLVSRTTHVDRDPVWV